MKKNFMQTIIQFYIEMSPEDSSKPQHVSFRLLALLHDNMSYFGQVVCYSATLLRDK